jgi:hypothetical protein
MMASGRRDRFGPKAPSIALLYKDSTNFRDAYRIRRQFREFS